MPGSERKDTYFVVVSYHRFGSRAPVDLVAGTSSTPRVCATSSPVLRPCRPSSNRALYPRSRCRRRRPSRFVDVIIFILVIFRSVTVLWIYPCEEKQHKSPACVCWEIVGFLRNVCKRCRVCDNLSWDHTSYYVLKTGYPSHSTCGHSRPTTPVHFVVCRPFLTTPVGTDSYGPVTSVTLSNMDQNALWP